MVIVRIRTMDISIYIEVQMIVLHRFKIHSLKKKRKKSPEKLTNLPKRLYLKK